MNFLRRGRTAQDEPSPSKRGKETNGLFTLSESTDPGSSLVELSFKQLGEWGDPYETWCDGEHLWLRDFLPRQVPGIRVLSFGYNSTVAFSKSTASIEEYSLDLLNRLLDERETAQERARPIIFICHSLGGIVMKKSLIIANERAQIYGNVLDNTKGVLFFGTPHRGSDVAYWTGFVARAVHATQLGTATNSELLTLLERNSKALAAISQQFVQRSAQLQICTFYETEKLDYMRELVVDKDSALLGLPNEQQFQTSANHKTICKFGDEKSQKYSPVWKSINRMVNSFNMSSIAELDRFASNEDYQECLKSLFLTEPADDYQTVRRSKGSRLEGTCEWVHDVDTFNEWLKTPGWQLFLLIGEPGIGKTMIATYLIDDLKKRTEQRDDTIFAYYFCDNKDEKRRSAQAILRSFLLQMLRQNPGLFSAISTDFKTQGAQLFSSPNSIFALWRIITTILKSATPSALIFVIDAYDECDEQSQETLLNLLQESFAKATDTRDVKILITTRRTRQVSRLQFEELPCLKLLRVDNGRVNADLSKFIDARVESLAKFRYSSSRRCSIAKILKSRALGTFLWVSLVVDELSKTVPSVSDQVLDRMPEKLVELYDRILRQIKPEHVEIVKNILLWVTNAFRPLTIAELSVATRFSGWFRTNGFETGCGPNSPEYNLSDGDSSLEEDRLGHTEFLAELELCPLVKYDEGTVYLIHQSAKDYLLDRGISTKFLPPVNWANFEIFQSCSKYLSSTAFALIDDLPESQDFDPLEDCEFVKYSCRYWSEHIQNSDAFPVNRTEWIDNVFILDNMKRQTFFDILWRREGPYFERINHMVTVLHVLAFLDLPKLVDVLLTPIEFLETMHHTDSHGRTALHFAASEGSIDLVKLLVSKGSSLTVEDSEGTNVLLEACQNGHYEIAEFLLKSGANPSTGSNGEYGNALHAALDGGNSALIELLLQHGREHGWDLNVPTRHGEDALTAAAQNGDSETVASLLDHGAKISRMHIKWCQNWATLWVLYERSKETILLDCSLHEGMINKFADLRFQGISQFLENVSLHGCPNVTDHLMVALTDSAKRLDTRKMELLLPLLTNTSKSFLKLGKILLEESSGRGFGWSSSKYAEVVKLLVSHGVNLNCALYDDQTPLSLAIRRADISTINMLLQRGAIMRRGDFGDADNWHHAASHSSGPELMELVNLAVDMGITPVTTLEHAMMICISQNENKGVQRLLCALACSHKFQSSKSAKGGETCCPWVVLAEDDVPRTPIELDVTLNLSCSKVYIENRKFFIMTRVATGLQEQLTYLPRARGNLRYAGSVFALLHRSAKGRPSHLNMYDDSVTALVHLENISMATTLIHSGWAGHPVMEVRNEALHCAARDDDYTNVGFFLDLGADPTSRYHGTTALYKACRSYGSYPSVAELLIRRGAYLNVIEGEYGCPLGAAANHWLDNFQTVRVLLQHGALADGPQDGSLDIKTPLYYAARGGRHNQMRLLIEAKADVNAKSAYGPLLISTYPPNKYLATVDLLLEHGADCHLTDQNGQTLLHLAVKDGRADIASRLLKAGANPDAADHSGLSSRTLADQHGHTHIQNLFKAFENNTWDALSAGPSKKHQFK